MGARASRHALALAAAIAPIASCQLVFPTVAEDAGAGDGAPRAETGSDAGPSADAAVYGDFSADASWETFDIVNAGYTFAGGTYDGRYVYLAPFGSDAERYDTHRPFTAKGSWESFDATQLSDAGAAGSLLYCTGAAFDGRYVYLVPNNDGLAVDVVFAQYDTRAEFTDKAAWRSFDVTKALGPSLESFAGSAFDGRYLYFVPELDGLVARYDTTATFDVAASWTTFDMTTVKTGASGLVGAIFDGRYVYFVPQENDATADLDSGGIEGDPDGIVMRYDTTAAFTSTSSWTSFDTAKLGGTNTVGFAGGAFDGRYVYLAPLFGLSGIVPRVDTQGEFTDAHSWSIFTASHVSGLADGFYGGAYDGRYVYMVPYLNTVFDGVVVRYDTSATFEAKSSWSSYDLEKRFGVGAVGFSGAVFDGEYMYFLPAAYTTVARFKARTPPETPDLPQFFGSFL